MHVKKFPWSYLTNFIFCFSFVGKQRMSCATYEKIVMDKMNLKKAEDMQTVAWESYILRQSLWKLSRKVLIDKIFLETSEIEGNQNQQAKLIFAPPLQNHSAEILIRTTKKGYWITIFCEEFYQDWIGLPLFARMYYGLPEVFVI